MTTWNDTHKVVDPSSFDLTMWRFNRMCGGYTNRYRLLTNLDGNHALYKAEGDLDRNISGWLSVEAMAAFLAGHIEGYDAATRRSAR